MELHDGFDSNLSAWRPEARVAPRLLGWNVPAEELIHIPSHWLSYPEPEPIYNYILGMLYIVFCVVALLGNGLVIWVFGSAKTLRTASNVFVINLAVCDFIMMLKTPIFIYNSFHQGFALGHRACQIFAFMGSCSGIGAGMTNAFIAYDRYRVIARPFDSKLSVGNAVTLVGVIWAYTLPWAVMPLLEVWGRFAPEGYLTSCTFDYLLQTPENTMFVLCIFLCSYVVPMSLIIYFYSQIVSHVVSHEKSLREQAKKMNVDSLRSNQQANQTSAEIRIAKVAIGICFLFVASWTPYAVMALIGTFGNKALLSPGVTMIPACACKAVACLDPYVYAISHPRYRSIVMRYGDGECTMLPSNSTLTHTQAVDLYKERCMSWPSKACTVARLELQKRLPWLCIQEDQPASDTASTATTVASAPVSG